MQPPQPHVMHIIRAASETDLTAIAALCQQWQAEDLTRNYRADTADELQRRLGECFLVAEVEGRVIGFVVAQIHPTAGNEFVEGVLDNNPAYLEVQDLYVAAAHRRKGLGTRLVAAVLDDAENRGVRGSLVYSANHDYVNTARFYERLGYQMWHIHMTRGAAK